PTAQDQRRIYCGFPSAFQSPREGFLCRRDQADSDWKGPEPRSYRSSCPLLSPPSYRWMRRVQGRFVEQYTIGRRTKKQPFTQDESLQCSDESGRLACLSPLSSVLFMRLFVDGRP